LNVTPNPFKYQLVSFIISAAYFALLPFFTVSLSLSGFDDKKKGSQLELSEETVLGVLSAMRGELGTLFGYTAENRGVGITGGVDFVEMDGPTVVIKIKGRFWHQRTTVLARVSNYLQQRIPEIIDVTVDDPWSLTDEANAVDFEDKKYTSE
jgi:hypothetical protein